MNISISGIHFHPHFRVSHMLIVLKIQMPSIAAPQFVHNFDFLTVSQWEGRHIFSSTEGLHYSCVPGVKNGFRFDDGNQAKRLSHAKQHHRAEDKQAHDRAYEGRVNE